MKNYDQSIEINHNPNWSYIPDYRYGILIIGGSGWLLNLIKHQRPDIDKTYLYVQGRFGWKYHLLINGRKKVGIEILKNPKAFIGYSQTINDVYQI